MPELDCCIVFTPDEPRLHTLNPNAWLILALAAGCTEAELEAAYLARTRSLTPGPVARRHLRDGLGRLLHAGVLEFAGETEEARP